jgi:hypothetical protein
MPAKTSIARGADGWLWPTRRKSIILTGDTSDGAMPVRVLIAGVLDVMARHGSDEADVICAEVHRAGLFLTRKTPSSVPCP